MFHRILICTDFTDGLQRLVHFVPQFAASGMQQIVFLHVVPLPEDVGVPRPDAEKVDRAQKQFAPALEQVPAGIEVKIEVQAGRAIDIILRTAKTHQCDVILMGTQSRNLFTEKLFGSTTADLSQRSTVPLMTVRPQLISALTSEELNLRCQHLFRGLLIPYDDSKASKHTVAQVAELANSKSEQTCYLCRVVDEGGRFELSEAEEQRLVSDTLKPAQAQLQTAGINAEIELRRGNSIVQILQAAQEKDVNAIAISSNSGNHGFCSVPSFAAELLRRSLHPVLFFPAPR
ncbi:MAG: universal stress protein [Phormidium tanganyikae FI6-MK23]|jgi:nucleotide-binding universal stress UspA family protein|nr:universal stress protein [Phormidium tanganyikae FI6-MK23]